MATIDDNTALLLYRVGPVLCAAPCLSISAIIEPPKLTHPPGSDPGRPGIFKYANAVVSSRDLRYKFGVDEADWANPGRTIVTQLAEGHVGFYVDEIRDVVSWPASGWGPLPALLPRGIFTRTLLLNEHIFLYADFKDLLRIPDSGYLRQYIQHLLEIKQHKNPVTVPPPAQTDVNSKTLTPQAQQTPVQTTRQQAQSTRPPLGKPNAAVTSRPIASAAPHTLPKKVVKRPPATLTHRQTDNVRVAPRPSTAHPGTTTQITSATTIHTYQPTPAPTPGAADTTAQTEMPARTVVSTNTIRHKDATTVSYTDTSRPVSYSAPARDKHESTRHTDYTHPLFVAFMLLLLFTVIGGAIWYVFPTNTLQTASHESVPVTSVVTPEPAPMTTDDPIRINDTHTHPVTQSEPSRPKPAPAVQHATIPPASTPAPSTRPKTTDHVTTSSARDHKPESIKDTYHASIKQDAQGLTITLDAPADDPVFAQTPMTTALADKTPKTTDTRAPATNTAATDNKDKVISTSPQSVEIIHIVVKGDTLWDIARRYVKNPFRYPELARLSKIKNPDLIYPGNRVRIIKHKHQP